MKKNSEKISWRHYFLPDWFFYVEERQAHFISPAATFNPVKALTGAPWQNSTKPSSELKLKKLILTLGIFSLQHSRAQWLSIIHWLHDQGFSIYLCLLNDDNNELVKVDASIQTQHYYQLMEQLTYFNKRKDYDYLAQHYNLPRAQVALLKDNTVKDFFSCFELTRYFTVTDVFEANAYLTLRPHCLLDKLEKPVLRCELVATQPQEFTIQSSDEQALSTVFKKNENFLSAMKSTRLSDYLHAFPKYSDYFITQFIKDIDYYEPLYRCIAACPDKITDIITHSRLLNHEKISINSKILFTANADLAVKIAAILMQHQDKLTHAELIYSLIKYNPTQTKHLLADKWQAIHPSEKIIFLKVVHRFFPEWLDGVLFDNLLEYSNELKLFKLLPYYPHKTAIILNKIRSTSFDNELELFVFFKKNSPYKNELFAQHAEGYLQFVNKLYPLFPLNTTLLANWLMQDETRITNGVLLSVCLIAYPQYAPHLLVKHGHQIKNEKDLLACANSCASLTDAKRLIKDKVNQCSSYRQLFQSYVSFRSAVKHDLYKWLFKASYLTKLADCRLSAIIYYAPEHCDQLLPKIKSTGEALTERLRQQQYLDTLIITTETPLPELKILPRTLTESIDFAITYYLYLGDLIDFNYLAEAFLQGQFKKLICLEITRIDLLKDQTAWETLMTVIRNGLCPKLLYLKIPKHVKKTLPPSTLQDLLGLIIDSNGTLNANGLINGAAKSDLTSVPPKPTALYIAKNRLQEQALANTMPTYTMVYTGKVLNHKQQKMPDLRTSIIKLSANGYEQFEEPILLAMDIPLFKPEAIKQLKDYQGQEHYYQLIRHCEAGVKTRLWSVDAQEVLISFNGIEPSQIKFWHGNDDFYYAQTNITVNLTYYLKSASRRVLRAKYDFIPEDDGIVAIINEYRRSFKYTKRGTTCPWPTIGEDRKSWLNQLYHERAGNCQQRCYAVWYKIFQNQALQDRLRLVTINDNHMRLEINYHNFWHQIDLGGSPSNLVYEDNPNNKLKQKKYEMASGSLTEQQQQLKSIFYDTVKLPTLSQLDELNTVIFSTPYSACLIITANIDNTANLLLKQARLKKQPLFYIDKRHSFSLNQAQITLYPHGTPHISQTDELDIFLQQASSYPAGAIILINWTVFTLQEQIALNTVLDRQKSLYGKPLNSTTRIVSLCAERPHDNSFLTRHSLQFIAVVVENQVPCLNLTANAYNIDVQGFPDWQALLFGSISLNNNQLVWQQGALTNFLLNQAKHDEAKCILIKNLPFDAYSEFEYVVKKASAQGVIYYHGYAMHWPDTLAIQVNTEPFCFQSFLAVAVQCDVTVNQIPATCTLINTLLFDYLLTDKTISRGLYIQSAGLLERAKQQRLALFITSSLSTNQWYCLLTQAAYYHVDLQLYLAPHVQLPPDLAITAISNNDESRNMQFSNSIYITNHASLLASKLLSPSTLAFAIEDYNYQDLVQRIHYQYSESTGFYAFIEQQSEVLTALQAGKAVMLYGRFSKELLQALAPLLLKNWSTPLTLIIEEQLSSAAKMEYAALNWLPLNNYQTIFIPPQAAEAKTVYQENEPALTEIDLTNAATEAQLFSRKRQEVVMNFLQNCNLVQLIGHTAVGKTFLIKAIAKSYSNQLNLYHEFNALPRWATDTSDKVKLLFIDEANIEDKHLTLFAPMKTNEAAILLHQGSFYQLTKNHKVIFARNPHDYGGGRNKQQLFNDNLIPEVHLASMPPAFIYEILLKPIYNTWLLPFGFAETDFQNECIKVMQNNANQPLNTRVLQEALLTYACRPLPTTLFSPMKASIPFNQHFILTPSTQALRLALNEFIKVRQKQRKTTVNGGIGLNGFLLEGRPGMGKSEAIRYSLVSHGYQEAKISDVNEGSPYFYYKLDASLALGQKKIILLRAFEEGNAVWLDEINSCIDDGLEKIINSLLSGLHPDSGQPPAQAGFMLLMTANSISMEGRSVISPAIRARCRQKTMPELSPADIHLIITHCLAKTEHLDIETMTDDIYHCFQQDKNLTLRELNRKLIPIADLYVFNQQSLVAALHKAIENRAIEKTQLLLNQYQGEPNCLLIKVNGSTILDTLLTSDHRELINTIISAIPFKQLTQHDKEAFFFNAIRSNQLLIVQQWWIQDESFIKPLIVEAHTIAKTTENEPIITWLENAYRLENNYSWQ